jgi:hypothetical protein
MRAQRRRRGSGARSVSAAIRDANRALARSTLRAEAPPTRIRSDHRSHGIRNGHGSHGTRKGFGNPVASRLGHQKRSGFSACFREPRDPEYSVESVMENPSLSVAIRDEAGASTERHSQRSDAATGLVGRLQAPCRLFLMRLRKGSTRLEKVRAVVCHAADRGYFRTS